MLPDVLPEQITQHQWQRMRPHLNAVFALLQGCDRISDGDREVCELLLPAWRSSSVAGRAVTVSELFGAEGAELGAWLARWRDRFPNDKRACQALGQLLGRVQDVEVSGLVVRRFGTQGGSAVWDCSPPSVP